MHPSGPVSSNCVSLPGNQKVAGTKLEARPPPLTCVPPPPAGTARAPAPAGRSRRRRRRWPRGRSPGSARPAAARRGSAWRPAASRPPPRGSSSSLRGVTRLRFRAREPSSRSSQGPAIGTRGRIDVSKARQGGWARVSGAERAAGASPEGPHLAGSAGPQLHLRRTSGGGWKETRVPPAVAAEDPSRDPVGRHAEPSPTRPAARPPGFPPIPLFCRYQNSLIFCQWHAL